MSSNTPQKTRRTVLKTAGSALAVASGGGLASAASTTDDLSPGQCVYADGDDGDAGLFDECGSDIYRETVENGTQGTVDRTCRDIYDEEWAYVVWDDGWTPDGWVPARELTACVTPDQ